jgi:molybdopterin molybdotransferase
MAQLSDDCFAFGGPLMGVDEAVALVAARVPPLTGDEEIGLDVADGRFLAQDIHACVDLPPFRNSAVDGWAVRFADLAPSGGTRLPVGARVIAGASAGQASAAGRAVRIFTGAPMPGDADTVFMQEDVTVADGAVLLPAGLKRGANMRPAGEDVPRGALALPKGRRLRPQDLALAAAIGHASLRVGRRPRVAIFSTGNELSEPGADLGPAAIYDANRPMLAGLLRRWGAQVTDLGIVRDSRTEMAVRLAAAARGHDLIVTSGGVSTGEEDHVKAAVEEAGSLVFWRIGIKPGRPVAMGVVGGVPFVGLPGNPVAVFVTAAFVLRPLVFRLAGGQALAPVPGRVRIAFRYAKKAGRREFVRVSLITGEDGRLEARKYPRDGAGVIGSLTETDGLIAFPEEVTDVPVGSNHLFYGFESLY